MEITLLLTVLLVAIISELKSISTKISKLSHHQLPGLVSEEFVKEKGEVSIKFTLITINITKPVLSSSILSRYHLTNPFSLQTIKRLHSINLDAGRILCPEL